ncbi:MAG: beta-N-acetylhexosaminidase [Actinomycetota bacterium]
MVLPLAEPLVPAPATARILDGSFALTSDTRVIADAGSSSAAQLLSAALSELTGISPAIVDDASRAGDIVLRTGGEGRAEGYSLTVADSVQIIGNDAAGVFFATQTLRQLLRPSSDGWSFAHAEIQDAPRFAYRGVMLDVARTFFPVDAVKSFIDRASSLKFNRLHLHLSDDQGWRVEVHSRPLLAERSSTTAALGRPGGFYTQDDYREIIEYAQDRHMVVVPEIDLPGHTHAIGLAYPEIVEEPVFNEPLLAQAEALEQPLPAAGKPYLGWGVGHSSVKVHEEATWEFLQDVLSEIASLTPGPYLHIGGDEALGTPQVDFDRFIERVTALVSDLGKSPVAWHEAGSAAVAPGTIGQFWGSLTPQGTHAQEARRFVERGGSLVLSPSDAAYLDMKYDEGSALGLTWAGTIDLRRAYEWEPTSMIEGVSEEQIHGVEAPLWTETIEDMNDVDQLFFPRAAAIAEVGWSPSSGADREWESFRARVGALGAHWDAAGWGGHRPAEIPWSTR